MTTAAAAARCLLCFCPEEESDDEKDYNEKVCARGWISSRSSFSLISHAHPSDSFIPLVLEAGDREGETNVIFQLSIIFRRVLRPKKLRAGEI
jgi:hypothetical protein